MIATRRDIYFLSSLRIENRDPPVHPFVCCGEDVVGALINHENEVAVSGATVDEYAADVREVYLANV